MTFLWGHFVATFIVLGIPFLVLFLSMYLSREEGFRKRQRREEASDWPDVNEWNLVSGKRIGMMIWWALIFLLAVGLTFNKVQNHSKLSNNTIIFASWVEQKYGVTADPEKADLIECYMGVLHYPQKEDKGLLPYEGSPRCDKAFFNKQKASLGLDGLREHMWVMNFVVALLWLVCLIMWGYWQIILKPHYLWVMKHNFITKDQAGKKQ
jgi:hypothetical protein